MKDNKVLEINEEVKVMDTEAKAGDQKSLAVKSPKQNKKEDIKEEVKESKIVYDVVLVFNEYKNRLDKYFEIDQKIVYERFSKELTAKLVADKLMEKGILVEIKSVILI